MLSIHLTREFEVLALPHRPGLVSALAKASDPGFIHPGISCGFHQFFNRPSDAQAQDHRPQRGLVEHQNMEEMRNVHEMMKPLHRVPIPGIEGLILISEVFFDENVFLDIPAMTRHPIAPF